MKAFKISYVLLLFSIFILIACATSTEPPPPELPSGTFHKESIQTGAVYALNSNDGLLLAGTETGTYKKVLEPGSDWNFSGLDIDSSVVTDFVIRSREDVLAVILYQTRGWQHDKKILFKSVNGGDTWDNLEFEYLYEGPYILDTLFVRGLEINPVDENILYANNRNVIISRDKGKTWHNLSKPSPYISDLLYVSKYHSNTIFIGGQTNIFTPFLKKSKDGGKTWERLDMQYKKGLTFEANCYDMLVGSNNSDNLLVAMTGIVRSMDGGNTWHQVFNKALIFTLARSASDAGVIYASGVNAAGDLFFAVSTNFGETWETVKMKNSPKEIYVNNMISVTENGREVLYFGTNKGIYSYTFE